MCLGGQSLSNEAKGGERMSAFGNVSARALIAQCPALENIRHLICRVVSSACTVLIHGETGVGKAIVARAIHEASDRCSKKLVTVNCTTCHKDLILSQLFGHERGAFTGALSHQGFFEVAEEGTIFLDEIGELTLEFQTKLLEVLDSGTFVRLGSTEERKANIRIIAATNRDLESLVKDGKFREDLYYRLNVFPIHVPPIRERKADILPLANYFLHVLDKNRFFSKAAQDSLLAYDWSGNTREIKNVVERALLLTDEVKIEREHLKIGIASFHAEVASATISSWHEGGLKTAFRDVEQWIVLGALRTSKGNMTLAGRRLGINRTAIYQKLRAWGVDVRGMPLAETSGNGNKSHISQS